MRPAERVPEHVFSRRVFVASATGGALWLALMGRLVQLQVVENENYVKASQENQFNREVSPAPRGVVYDRMGRVLAASRRAYRIVLAPDAALAGAAGPGQQPARRRSRLLNEDELQRLEVIARRAVEATRLEKVDVTALIEQARTGSRFDPLVLSDDASWEALAVANLFAPELPGVRAEVSEVRNYPWGASFAHVVGYVAKPTDKDIVSETARLVRSAYPEIRDEGAPALTSLSEKLLRGRFEAAISRRSPADQNWFERLMQAMTQERGAETRFDRRRRELKEVERDLLSRLREDPPFLQKVLTSEELASVPILMRGDALTRALDLFERTRTQFKHPGMRVGKSGIERSMDVELRGQAGVRLVEVDAAGRAIGVWPEGSTPPVPGRDTVLTLDAELQDFAVRRLLQARKEQEEKFSDPELVGESASVVVMDVQTGDVITLLSFPGFDPNKFVNGIPRGLYRDLLENKEKPLYHKAVTGLYPPGSTFKMVTAMAALEAGVISPQERVNCPGVTIFGGGRYHCWNRSGHGPMNMHDGIKHSCDCYFYEVARRAGVDAIAKTAREFGLGKRYPIGLEGVAAGIVPTEAWKLEKRKSVWNPGETLITGIGQGFIITSPLQLAVMTARIASGRAVEPRLTRPAGEARPPQFPRLSPDITDAMLRIIQDGMYGVSNEPGGTAVRPSQLDLGEVKMAGKTGTAQVRRITLEERARGVRSNDQMPWNLRDHALFVCYAPADRPRYACAVVVDHGGGGSKAAAPIARDVIRECLIRTPADKPVFTPHGRTAGPGVPETGRGA